MVNSIAINNTPVTNTSMMVGYLANSYGIGKSVYTTVSQAAKAGYNVQVVAFAMLQDMNPMQFYGNQFLAYTGYETFQSCPQAQQGLVNDIANAKKYYGLKYALVSVGGENSTFSIQSSDNVNTMAQNVVSFVQANGLDGIDFDIEIPTDATLFNNLIAAIRQLSPTIIITAAPQSNSSSGGVNTSQFVTTGMNTAYTTAFANGYFNFVWLQGYNTGGNYLNSTINNVSTGNCDETMTCFIPAAYGYYTSSASGTSQLPSNTLFVVGQPATIEAAGLATIWNNPSYSSNAAVYSSLAANYQAVQGLPQSGGAMTWSINQDIDGGCGFANAVAPVVTGNTNINCPTNGTSYNSNICY